MKQYTLDTNVFRYKSGDDYSEDIRNNTEIFWAKMIEEVKKNEAVLLVPKEVARELNIQSFSLVEETNNKIAELLGFCKEIEPENYNIDIEYSLRKIVGYVQAHYKGKIDHNITRLEASDARILYTAYAEDSILVTANIKDFMLYPLLFDKDEDRLYCMRTNQYIKIPAEMHEQIHQDTDFIKLLEDFYNMEINGEEESE